MAVSNTSIERGARDLEALLLRIAEGDRRAFRVLYAETAPKLLGLLRQKLGDERDAGDVLQVVYLSIWRRAGQFRPEKGKAFTWMLVIARNAAIDHLRRRRVDCVSDEGIQEIADGAATPFQSEQSRRVRAVLSGLLDTLPERQRDAVRLRYFDDLSFEEVAGRMRVPVNTAKSLARRGVIALRGHIGEAKLDDLL